ncbi:hypothetical protein PROFUN_01492 [Planoprotostelium fungivorum]|uniref:Uncharacterized protein n=1 Tax=Planoprotostelium fungivorum TaxID=1890364 RepID=A0A2P6NTI0_9EUKA|nr:hypothetical protein PROFUN_01492 [Planoprotostelium fungivorum]
MSDTQGEVQFKNKKSRNIRKKTNDNIETEEQDEETMKKDTLKKKPMGFVTSSFAEEKKEEGSAEVGEAAVVGNLNIQFESAAPTGVSESIMERFIEQKLLEKKTQKIVAEKIKEQEKREKTEETSKPVVEQTKPPATQFRFRSWREIEKEKEEQKERERKERQQIRSMDLPLSFGNNDNRRGAEYTKRPRGPKVYDPKVEEVHEEKPREKRQR